MPFTAATVGVTLRAARVQRRLSIADVADRSKVPRAIIETIEGDEMSRLPAGIITRGYLRAIADTIGADREAIVAEYVREYPAKIDVPLPAARAGAMPADDRLRRAGWTIGLLLATGLMWWYRQDGALPPRHAVLQPDPLVNRASLRPVLAPPQPVPAIRLEISVVGECWLSIVADDAPPLEGLFGPGRSMIVDADERLAVRVGAPGAFEYTINGAPGRPLDGARPVTLEITADNYQQFVLPAPAAAGSPAA